MTHTLTAADLAAKNRQRDQAFELTQRRTVEESAARDARLEQYRLAERKRCAAICAHEAYRSGRARSLALFCIEQGISAEESAKMLDVAVGESETRHRTPPHARSSPAASQYDAGAAAAARLLGRETEERAYLT